LYTETSSLRTLKITPRNLNEIDVHELGFWIKYGTCELDPAVKINTFVIGAKFTFVSSFFTKLSDCGCSVLEAQKGEMQALD
jgi:hypothetical protein